MLRNAQPMGDAPKSKAKAKPKPKAKKATVTATTGRGRPKAPIEKRVKYSDRPHRGRVSPPDVPTGATLDPGAIPEDPPIPLNDLEREAWDRIVKSQRAMEVSAWIFRSDCEFLLAACAVYGRWRQVRNEIDESVENGNPFFDLETGKANPLLAIEKSLAATWQQSLKELAMVPARRQVSVAEDKDEDEDIGYLD